MTQPIIIEAVIAAEDVTREDGGKAFIVNVYSEAEPVHVSLVSYDEAAEYPYPTYTPADEMKGHERIRELVGKKVRVTIEVIDREE